MPISLDDFDFSAVPNDSDVVMLRSFIAEKEVELAALEAKTKAMRGLLKRASQCIAPIRRLVPDVLDYIFRMCIEDNPLDPWKLGAVCTSWRAALLASPARWSRIVLYRQVDGNRAISLLRLWLERIGSRSPLALEINVTRPGRPWPYRSDIGLPPESVRTALTLLLPLAGRWKHFTLVLMKPFPELTKKIQSPILETVSLSSGGEGNPVAESALIDVLSMIKAPRLRKASFLNWSKLPMTKLSNLEHLSYAARYGFRHVAYSSVLDMLALNTRLRSLTLGSMYEDKEGFRAEARQGVVLPRLVVLELSTTAFQNALLASIRTPSLSTVTLRRGKELETCLNLLTSQDPVPPISRLKLKGSDIDSFPQVDPYLPKLSSLRHLEFGLQKYMTKDMTKGLDALYRPSPRVPSDNGGEVWAMPLLSSIKLVVPLGEDLHVMRGLLEAGLEQRSRAARLRQGPSALAVQVVRVSGHAAGYPPDPLRAGKLDRWRHAYIYV